MYRSDLRRSKDVSESLKIGTVGYITYLIKFYSIFVLFKSIFLEENKNQLLIIFGIFVGLLGVILLWSAKSKLAENYSPLSSATLPKFLVRDGIYKKLRNPIYTSNLIILLGVLFITGYYTSILICIFALLAIYLKAISREEKALLNIFGEEYSLYLKSSYRLFWFIY